MRVLFLLLGLFAQGLAAPQPVSAGAAIILDPCVPGVYDPAQVCFVDPGDGVGRSTQAYFNYALPTSQGLRPGLYSIEVCPRVITSVASVSPALFVFAFPVPPATPGAALPNMRSGPWVLRNMTTFVDAAVAEGVMQQYRVAPPVFYYPADTSLACSRATLYLSAQVSGNYSFVPVQAQWMEFSTYTGVTSVIFMLGISPA